jgi:hypothetical protein
MRRPVLLSKHGPLRVFFNIRSDEPEIVNIIKVFNWFDPSSSVLVPAKTDYKPLHRSSDGEYIRQEGIQRGPFLPELLDFLF